MIQDEHDLESGLTAYLRSVESLLDEIEFRGATNESCSCHPDMVRACPSCENPVPSGRYTGEHTKDCALAKVYRLTVEMIRLREDRAAEEGS